MLPVSEKLSLGTEILRKIVLGNVTVPFGRTSQTWRKASHVKVCITVRRLWSACAINVQIVCIEESTMDPDIACDSTPPSGFDKFMASLREGDSDEPIISARRFATALHIDMQTLARLAHVHRNTVSRLAGSESVQKFLRDALRIIRAAADISGDVQRTLFWYRNEPLPTFDYKTAEWLVSEGRTEDLLRYITSLETGAAG